MSDEPRGFAGLLGATFKAIGGALAKSLEADAQQRLANALSSLNIKTRRATAARVKLALGRPELVLQEADRTHCEKAVNSAVITGQGQLAVKALAKAIEDAEWTAIHRVMFYQLVSPSPNLNIQMGGAPPKPAAAAGPPDLTVIEGGMSTTSAGANKDEDKNEDKEVEEGAEQVPHDDEEEEEWGEDTIPDATIPPFEDEPPLPFKEDTVPDGVRPGDTEPELPAIQQPGKKGEPDG